jgi:phosphoribosylglycinamide formyltransferase-1
MIAFKCIPFAELTIYELYEILMLRAEVFVVEQKSPFQDPDGLDLQAWHCIGTDEAGKIVAYTRLFAKGVVYDDYTSIGRVVASPLVRGQSLGKKLMRASIDYCRQLFGNEPIKIGAQTYLLKFYESQGFVSTGEEYLEDGIPHTKMVLKLKRIAIFASGSGTNAEKIAVYFSENIQIEIALILTNNAQAGVIERAKRLDIPVVLFDRKQFYETNKIVQLLQNQQIDLVVLAGFMMLVPQAMVAAYPNKIVNIHPALLPKFGGKGMYGDHVHNAVVAAGETESGITIHYVNEHYDEGAIVFQASCPVLPTDNPDDVAHKIHALEHQHYPTIIERILGL